MARPRSKIVKPKRARGGQPGNTNRLKHGFYSRHERLGRAKARALLASARLMLAGGVFRLLAPAAAPGEEDGG